MQLDGHMAEHEPEMQDKNQSVPEKPVELQANGEDIELGDVDPSADADVEPPAVDPVVEQKPPKPPGKREGKTIWSHYSFATNYLTFDTFLDQLLNMPAWYVMTTCLSTILSKNLERIQRCAVHIIFPLFLTV